MSGGPKLMLTILAQTVTGPREPRSPVTRHAARNTVTMFPSPSKASVRIDVRNPRDHPGLSIALSHNLMSYLLTGSFFNPFGASPKCTLCNYFYFDLRVLGTLSAHFRCFHLHPHLVDHSRS